MIPDSAAGAASLHSLYLMNSISRYVGSGQ